MNNIFEAIEETKDFTPSDFAEAEKIYKQAIEQHQTAINQDIKGTLERIYKVTAVRQVKAEKENQKKHDIRLSELIQLPLFPYPDTTRIISNDMARSALFAAIQGGNRKQLKKELLATIDGIEIIFTGEQLNQDDHDLLMQLVHLAKNKPFGEKITVPANTILSGLGLGKGGKDHEELKTKMERLLSPLIALKNTRTKITYYGHIIDKAIQDETKKHWVYNLNPDLRPLYDVTSFSLIEWQQRKALKRKDLARWLHSFYSSHAQPYHYSVKELYRLSGSTAELKSFRRSLKIALDLLINLEFFIVGYIDKDSDLVSIKRNVKIQK
jgi:hypothetical protein